MLCVVGLLLLDETAPEVIRHADATPTSPGPTRATPYDMGVTGRDVRIVDGAYTGDPDAPVGPPVLDAWVRFDELPDDRALHAASGPVHRPPVDRRRPRPHAGIGQDEAHDTLSTAINAIRLSLHADVRADQWMRYHHHSTFAGDGMTHAECRVHDEGGGLVASFAVDAMVRPFADRAVAGDERTAL